MRSDSCAAMDRSHSVGSLAGTSSPLVSLCVTNFAPVYLLHPSTVPVISVSQSQGWGGCLHVSALCSNTGSLSIQEMGQEVQVRNPLPRRAATTQSITWGLLTRPRVSWSDCLNCLETHLTSLCKHLFSDLLICCKQISLSNNLSVIK